MTARLITRIFSFFLLASALFDVSCTRVTDLRPEGRGEVVVVCVLTEEATQTLTLDLTDIASPEDRAALSEAEITLFDETAGNEAGRFLKGDGKDWQLEYAAIPEHAYQLKIEIPGRDSIFASTKMPAKSGIKCDPRWLWKSFWESEESDRDLGMQYEISSLPEGPVWVMGINYNAAADRNEVAAEIATSLDIADPFNITGAKYQSAVFLESDVLEEIRKLKEYGKVGFYDNVEGHPLYDKMLRIPSIKEVDREAACNPPGYFSVAGSFKYRWLDEAYYYQAGLMNTESIGFILFISPSVEYDRYLKDVIAKRMLRETWADYVFLFSRENVYTNIINGLGVFGAKTEQRCPWNNRILHFYTY
jgi:hypothetical protein